MKKILVLCEDYPSPSHPYKMAWAHTRNVFYNNAGFLVNVCSFSANRNYEFQGVAVCNPDELPVDLEDEFDVFIAHSPNIRNHFPLLLKIKTKPILIFCHGTESLYLNYDYCPPFDYMRDSLHKRIVRNVYDFIKMRVMRWFVSSRRNHLMVIFVSNWIKDKYVENIGSLDCMGVGYEIINNSLWPDFYDFNYIDIMTEKFSADFVTMRRLDYSKYCIDLVVNFANCNPQFKFHIVGEGNYFSYHKLPSNVVLLNKHVPQSELTSFLKNYRCALMPTRVDAQGVMVCEMATFGMPVITTDITVCKEMFSDFPNVFRLNEADFATPFEMSRLPLPIKDEAIKKRFSLENTVFKEISLLNQVCTENP